MAVFRVEKNKGYTVMSNHHLRNKDLTLKAKGLLSQRLTVTNRQGEPLDGAVYGLYKSNGEFVQMLVTDMFGVATSGDIPVDTDYYIEEISPPEGYLLNAERKNIVLTEVCAPSRVDVAAEYDPIVGKIKVIKTDENGNPLQGVGFYVYRSTDWALMDTITTDAQGLAITVDLPYGWYELYEYTAPDGYDSGGYYMHMVSEHEATVELSIVNTKSRGYARVYKTGDDERKIQGAVFSVYTSGDVWIEDITTNSSGHAYSSGLLLGNYYVVEKSVPAGYTLDTTKRPFTLSYSGQYVYLDIVNNRSGASGKVKIVKTDDSANPLDGVVFGLYRAWDNKKLADLTTGSDGSIESAPLIPDDYYLIELTGKTGYTMVSGQIPFTIDGSGVTVTKTVENPKIRIFGKVKVTKTDDAGTPMEGVKLGVYCHLDNLIEELTTGSDGTANSGGLNEGDYYIKEIAGLTGYLMNDWKHPFSIAVNNAVVPVTVVNPRITGSIKVIKTDGAHPLKGVVFGVYDSRNIKVCELATGDDGTAVSPTLYYGGYELLELSTVDGYELIDTPIPFSIMEQDAIIEISVSNTLILGKVSVFKTGKDDMPLSGAVFGLYNAQGQKIAELTTGSNGAATSGNLVKGSYYLKELIAPEGYVLPDDMDC